MFAVFLLYFSALHTSLARSQGLSLIVTTDSSTALKVNGMTGDIFIIVSGPVKVIVDLWIGHPMVGVLETFLCLDNRHKTFHKI